MNKVRICTNNIFDQSEFTDYSDDSYPSDIYIEELYQKYTGYQQVNYLTALNAQNPSRSHIMFTAHAGTYNLRGRPYKAENINYIALNRVSIPATAKLTLYMWNEIDWSISSQDYSAGYTAKFSADNIGQATGWGVFDWGTNWGGMHNITDNNPMSSTIILWFDETKYGYSLTDESDVVLVDKTVNNVIRWRLEIDFLNNSGPPGSLITERINIGEYTELKYNMTHGHSLIFADPSKQFRTLGGTLASTFAPRFKQLKVSFPVISPADRSILSSIFARVGVHKDIIFSLYPKNSDQQLEIDYTVAGKFKKVPSLVERIGGYYKTTMEIGET